MRFVKTTISVLAVVNVMLLGTADSQAQTTWDARASGDDCESAMIIPSLPFSDTGTTAGFADDYDEVCPHDGSTSPDVIYSLTPASNTVVDISLCADSDYDTKLYIYEGSCPGPVVACNDDLCPDWTSQLMAVGLMAGVTYFIVVDGYGGESGNYTIDITKHCDNDSECDDEEFCNGEESCHPVIGCLHSSNPCEPPLVCNEDADTCEPPTTRWYVDDDGDAAGGCTSWADACPDLQSALDLASSRDQIWVGAGFYSPDYNVGTGQHTGDRTTTFQLINGLALYGGFPNGGGPWESRDPQGNETILSGDLNGDDLPGEFPSGPSFQDNSYHVVTGSGTDSTAILDGFTVTAGNATVAPDDRWGGGMYTYEGSPTVANCTFSGNSADSGGGMRNEGSGNATITKCTFSGNTAVYAGGGISNDGDLTVTSCTFTGNSAGNMGGGMYNQGSSYNRITSCTFSGNSANSGGGMRNDGSLVLMNCMFIGNSSGSYGGGIYSTGSIPIAMNCLFIGNSASYGGGMTQDMGSLALTNCTFSGNSASEHGGGMYNYLSSATLDNCTFAANSAPNGRAISCDSWEQQEPSNLELANCILWDGGDEIWNNDGSTITITYSDVQDGWPGGGVGNIAVDPLFVDADGLDNIPGTADDDLRLSTGSPSIDSGNNAALPPEITTDIDGNPRFVDDPDTDDCPQPGADCGTPPIVDMGAYEFQGSSEPIPTVSEWGLMAMTLLALTAATIVFSNRRRPAPA